MNIDYVTVVGRVFLIVAAIGVTSFPILYLFSPWYKTALGRVMMLQGTTFAMVINLKVILTFWDRSEAKLVWLNTVILFLLTTSSYTLTYLLWVFNYRPRDLKELIMSDIEPKADHLLTNKTYDVLKKSTTVVLPAIGTLYFTLAQIWGLPAAEEVVGTVTAVNLFLGLVLGLGAASYNNSESKYGGTLEVGTNDVGNPKATFSLNEDPTEVQLGKEVVFKVVKPT